MLLSEADKKIRETLKNIYDEGEAAAISELIIERLTGSRSTARVFDKEKLMTPEQNNLLEKFLQRLSTNEPVQYVLNEAWFCGMKFYVDKNVLIPRAETEELVDWIVSDCKFPIDRLSILDIGSGSGAIPIALKKKFRKAEVWSCEIDEAALSVAKKNSSELGVDVNFILMDFLDNKATESLGEFDIIVSNPPYIPLKEKDQMPRNVADYEPELALFVKDNNPAVFYKAIAEFGKLHLIDNGKIYVELHENLSKEVNAIFIANGYTTEIKKDMQGKSRMLKAWK